MTLYKRATGILAGSMGSLELAGSTVAKEALWSVDRSSNGMQTTLRPVYAKARSTLLSSQEW
jgi:hypothetical protein